MILMVLMIVKLLYCSTHRDIDGIDDIDDIDGIDGIVITLLLYSS